MTNDTLKTANEISSQIDLLNQVIGLEPSGDNYGTTWKIINFDPEIITKLVKLYADDFVHVFIMKKAQLEQEFQEL